MQSKCTQDCDILQCADSVHIPLAYSLGALFSAGEYLDSIDVIE